MTRSRQVTLQHSNINILGTDPSCFYIHFDRFLGSGQKLLGRLLDEHPFVTVKQPSNYIRHVSLFSEAWYEEESLETNRLNEGGILKEVLLDTLQVCSKLRLFTGQCLILFVIDCI